MNKQELEKNLASVWKTPKMVSHCLRNSKYVELHGWFVNVCDSKPSIQNVMCYDDEADIGGIGNMTPPRRRHCIRQKGVKNDSKRNN